MLRKNYITKCILTLCLLLVYSISYADHTHETQIVKKILPSVVEVASYKNEQNTPGQMPMFPPPLPGMQKPKPNDPKGQPTHMGSGFVISSDGYIVTNAHVINNIIDGGKAIITFKNDDRYDADLINYDEESDIALLKIIDVEPGKTFPYVRWGDTPELGEKVIAIGSPMNQSFTVTFGNVSFLNRFVPSSPSFVPFIQTDAAINPGNSGGPLFNVNGELVGINTMIISPSAGRGQAGSVGIGFAIDGNYAQTVIKLLKTGNKIERPFLGVSYRPVKKEELDFSRYNKKSAFIMDVVPDSPAFGVFKRGDIILQLNAKNVDWRMLASQIKSSIIGSTAKFNVLRDKLMIQLEVILRPKQEKPVRNQ